ncbi:hypothetical protein M5X04_11165 [Paenibacillus alvei]|uniref:Uncharacterized protein n=2 Tax=Paenibacillus alvei TaxID=44250 RepID=A0ABT4E837_PAEAL|nr:hypothetical protein [Paenibacillus alvei]EPY13147.1 hypothetical protein PAAL66ix_08861 [Paenibacillus alvei A6-6i-x]MCY9529892.1 hypothetical protein [Paenibacillus alvei]
MSANTNLIHNYKEAVELIRQVGILPLANLAPHHPSLAGVTEESAWHSDTDADPWRWRVQFPGNGVAAYGKFIKKKGVFISLEWVSIVRSVLGDTRSVKERYAAGEMSPEAKLLYGIIVEHPGIDTRLLRVKADMKSPDQKKAFDNALNELQGTMDIVISGVTERRNSAGEVNGWNSTSYETIDHWLENLGIETSMISVQDAKEQLYERLARSTTSEALTYFTKTMKLR